MVQNILQSNKISMVLNKRNFFLKLYSIQYSMEVVGISCQPYFRAHAAVYHLMSITALTEV